MKVSYFIIIFIICQVVSTQISAQNRQLIDSLYLEAENTQELSDKAALYNDLSFELVETHPKEAYILAKKALSIYIKQSDQSGIASSYNNIAGAFDYTAQFDSAMYYYQLALGIRMILNDKKGAANILNNMGASCHFRSDYSQALDYYIQSATLREEINDLKGMAQSMNNMGIVYRAMKDYQSAVKIYHQSIILKEKGGDWRGKALTLINLSNAYQNLNNLDSAEISIREAINIFDELKDSGYVASAYVNLGSILKSKKKYDEAEKILTSALLMLQQLDLAPELSDCEHIIGLLYAEQKNYTQALQHLYNAEKIAKRIQKNELLSTVYLSIANTLAENGQKDRAYDYQLAYHHIKDSLFTVENQEQLNQLQQQYQSQQRDRQIERLQSHARISELELNREQRRKNMYFLLSAIALCISMIVAYFLWQKNKSNQKIVKQASIINQSLAEKEILIREIHHRVKNNLQIIAGLLELQDSPQNKSESKIVAEAQGRIKSMSIIHEMLYQTDNLSGISFSQYIERMIKGIEQGFSSSALSIQKIYPDEPVHFNIDTIIPLGLIINEIITNAYKHVFSKGYGNQLRISIKPDSEYEWALIIEDNGPGMPSEQDIRPDSFGLKLMKMLARQLRGKVSIQNNQGAAFIIYFREIKNSAI